MYTSREEAERLKQQIKDSVTPAGTSGRSFSVKKLNMLITMRPGKDIMEWIDRYVDQKFSIANIRTNAKINDLGANHRVFIPKIPKKKK